MDRWYSPYCRLSLNSELTTIGIITMVLRQVVQFLPPEEQTLPLAVEDDYAITLDLSKPLDYSYSANRWGIIGSATAGGWDSDQNMSWNAVGGVFTATINLTVGEMKFRANDDWGLNLGG